MPKPHLELFAAILGFGATTAFADGHEAECATGYDLLIVEAILTAATSMQFARIGYALSADAIEPYDS